MTTGEKQFITNIERSSSDDLIYRVIAEKIDCLVLPAITVRLSQIKIDKSKISIPAEIRLADPAFDEPGPIFTHRSEIILVDTLCRAVKRRQHQRMTAMFVEDPVGMDSRKRADNSRSHHLSFTIWCQT